jgi:hypothetical protein
MAFSILIGLVGASVAQEIAEPASFQPSAEARPISEADATEPGSTLRWKNRPPVTVGEYVASNASSQPINPSQSQPQQPLRAGWNITRIDPAVRPAQHVAADPFTDPFGDRKSDSHLHFAAPANGMRNTGSSDREPQLMLQPTQAEAGIEELPAPRTLSPVRRAAPTTPALTASQPSLAGQQPPTAGFGGPPVRSSAPCDRTYNDRNCCEVDDNCTAFRNRLLSESIKNISLDITPRYNPDLTPDKDEEDRADKLRLLESRTWTNRRGAVVATGKMSNLHNNAVVIADESGRETARIPVGELGEDEMCYVTAWWRLPSECQLGGIRGVRRDWLAGAFQYHASALCHKPLYFEEVQLERYGHTAGPFRQPVFSGAHFIISLAALPYQMGMHPPMECQYSLGYYRPGSCAPWMIPPIPLSWEGAKWEIATALGMSYLIP